MTTPAEQEPKRLILHIEDAFYFRRIVSGAIHDNLDPDEVALRSYASVEDLQRDTSTDEILLAPLLLGAIVAIIDGELGNFTGEYAALRLRRRVQEVIDTHPAELSGRTVANSLVVISYAGNTQRWGDKFNGQAQNYAKIDLLADELVLNVVSPILKATRRP